MLLKENAYVRLRLLINPKIFNPKNFTFAITYITFAVRRKGGEIIQNKTHSIHRQNFTRNPNRDKDGLIAIDTVPFWLYNHTKNDEIILENLSKKRGMATFTVYYKKGSKVIEHEFNPEWMLVSEKSISTYSWHFTDSLNGTHNNTKKTAQINQFPFLIAKSENFLFDQDSQHSLGKKLPDKFSTRNETLYTMGKEALLKELLNLMEWGATGENEKVAKKIATDFVKNQRYSLANTYSYSTLINTIRNSNEFKNYVNDISKLIKSSFQDNNYIIDSKNLLVKHPIKRLYFDGGKYYENYWGTGLGITLHQISYIEVELNNVTYNNSKPSKLMTTFILYDTYGLDREDMEKYGTLDIFSKEAWGTFTKDRDSRAEGISTILGWGFNCWWSLQYYYDCVPLLIKLRIENVEISL